MITELNKSLYNVLLTHPCFVKVLHGLDVGHLAVLCPGQSQEREGHNAAQHSNSKKEKN